MTALYPGSFDPFTNGHLNILKKALKLFDTVIVGSFHNPMKGNGLIPANERIKVIKKALASEISPDDFARLRFKDFGGQATTDACTAEGATVLIRGLRSVTDYEFELQLAMVNKSLTSYVETVLLIPDLEYQFISSTTVRQLLALCKYDAVKALVPAGVYNYLMEEKGR